MNNSPTILLVDDDADDVLLFRYALGESALPAELRVVHNGLDAVKYLSGYGVFGNRAEFPMPGLVLLDLQMPGLDGLGVLRWVRRQHSLVNLPVVVFTGSDHGPAEAIENGADVYLRKGADTSELLALLQQVNLGWQRNGHGTHHHQPDPVAFALNTSDRYPGLKFA
ncbi:MAG TPA: response regulator [Candidatus Limnocylindria bacterium]|nr:response regulator [Candidatus Limnocylindria bacterium]